MDSKKEYVQRMLSREAWTDSDKKWMMDYLDNNDLSVLEMLSLESYNSDVLYAPRSLDKAMSGKILQNIHQAIQIDKPKPKFLSMYWVSAAAIIIVMLGIAMLKHTAIANVANSEHMQVAKTNAGERKTIILYDGSVVTLEGNSELAYPERFGEAAREVNLKGEAFIEVAKDQQHPFIVHSPLLHTTVMGTSFEVMDDSVAAKVVVATGAVKVQAIRGNQQALMLSATEAAVLAKDGASLEKMSLPAESHFYQQRKTGQFIYHHTPVMDVIRDMELNYKVGVQVDDEIKSYSFTGSFATEETLDKVLEIIAQTMNAKVFQPASNAYRIGRGAHK